MRLENEFLAFGQLRGNMANMGGHIKYVIYIKWERRGELVLEFRRFLFFHFLKPQKHKLSELTNDQILRSLPMIRTNIAKSIKQTK